MNKLVYVGLISLVVFGCSAPSTFNTSSTSPSIPNDLTITPMKYSVDLRRGKASVELDLISYNDDEYMKGYINEVQLKSIKTDQEGVKILQNESKVEL